MAMIDWQPAFNTGISRVDMQHQNLVNMINDLHDGMMSGQGKEALEAVLKRMAVYATKHFATEEEMFAKYGYAGKADHEREHKAFVEKVTALLTDLEAGKVALSVSVLNFLKDWLSHHILEVDQAYAPFLKSKGVE